VGEVEVVGLVVGPVVGSEICFAFGLGIFLERAKHW